MKPAMKCDHLVRCSKCPHGRSTLYISPANCTSRPELQQLAMDSYQSSVHVSSSGLVSTRVLMLCIDDRKPEFLGDTCIFTAQKAACAPIGEPGKGIRRDRLGAALLRQHEVCGTVFVQANVHAPQSRGHARRGCAICASLASRLWPRRVSFAGNSRPQLGHGACSVDAAVLVPQVSWRKRFGHGNCATKSPVAF